MTNEKLNEVLEKHKMWLTTEKGGERAVLSDEDLSGADFRSANLSDAVFNGSDLSGADLRGANLRCARLRDSNLRGARLIGADLRNADLKNADLKGADLDYSCLPLWCGSLTAHFDDKQLRQIAYHLVKAGLNSKNASRETKIELNKLVDFANGFHRVGECGKIKNFSEVEE